MYPILYESIQVGTVPQDHGLGILSDCISCQVEEGRNDIYELTLEYPATGIHAKEFAYRRIIKAKPNPTDDPQLFRIDRISKEMNGKFTVYAKHISYDLSGYIITSGSAINAQAAVELLNDSAPGYLIETTKEVTANFAITEPSSVRSWFGGKEGSLLDVYGTGEWKYNNFHCKLFVHRGVDAEHIRTTIRYGKNLLELSQDKDCSNIYTHVLCFYKNEEGIEVVSNQISTGLSLDTTKTLVVDVSSEYETVPTQAVLDLRAQQYINNNNLTTPSDNITLNFVQSGELKDRVDLCDVVNVYYEALGINVQMKCIRTKFDCLREKYIETEFGDVRRSLADTVLNTSIIASDAKANSDMAISEASSKKRTFLTTPIPPYDRGDIWVFNGVIYACNVARPFGYVNYLGITTTEIGEGSSTQNVTINGQTHTAQENDVVFYDDQNDETENDFYIWIDGAWTDYATHIIGNDWRLATNYVDESKLEREILEATQSIIGATGGNVVINYNEVIVDDTVVMMPYEILILCDSTDISTATKIWRWNAGGLGYSKNGYDGPYETAISIDPLTGDGQINANFITVGSLDAEKVTIQNLTANMFKGQEIVLGGINDNEGRMTLKDASGNVIGIIDSNGLEFFGATVNNVTPSVVFDKNGVTGYSDSSDRTTKTFWTYEDEFHMKNAVVENEITAFGKIKLIPMTVYSGNTVVNDGIGFVAIV